MAYNADGTRAERTDPPTLPPDLGSPGEHYPNRGLRFPEVIALGVCSWVRPDGVTCGMVHTRCKGHAQGWAGAPCAKNRAVGQLVCGFHGGAAPNAIRQAARRLATEQATNEAGALLEQASLAVAGQSLGEQLVGAINRAGAMALGYQWLLGQLPHESEWSFEEHYSETGTPTRWVNIAAPGVLGPDAKGQMVLHAYEEGLRYWTTLHGRLLVEAAKLGLDERRQLFAESQVATIGDAVSELVAALGLDLNDPAVVPVVEAFLRRIAGETPKPPLDVIDLGDPADDDDGLSGALVPAPPAPSSGPTGAAADVSLFPDEET